MKKNVDPEPLRMAWLSSQTLVQIADTVSVMESITSDPLPLFDLLAMAGFPCSQQCGIMPDMRRHFLHHLFKVDWANYHEAFAMMPIIETVIAVASLRSLDGKRHAILDAMEADGLKYFKGKVHRNSGDRFNPWEPF